MSKTYFQIRLIDSITRESIGDFEYVTVPRIGDWFLTPDNDGSGEWLWMVDAVLHFPRYGRDEPSSTVIYGTTHRVTHKLWELHQQSAQRYQGSS